MKARYMKDIFVGTLIFLAIFSAFDCNGEEVVVNQWTRQPGPGIGSEVVVDSSGNAYIYGYTNGTMDGNTNAGGYDTFIAKYDTNGNRQWIRQFGTSDNDTMGGSSLAIDKNDNIYATGYTWANYFPKDMFLVKFDSSGNEIWIKFSGTGAGDVGQGVATDDSGNIYVTGTTWGSLAGYNNSGGPDITLYKFDPSGNEVWHKQWGTTGNDDAMAVAVDPSGNIYVAGRTTGDLGGNGNAGWYDIFLDKFDSAGNRLPGWPKQWGGGGLDDATDVTTDSNGNVYVIGRSGGGWGHEGNVFLTKFDALGNMVWDRHDPTAWTAGAIALDKHGFIYLTSSSSLMKYDPLGNKLWSQSVGGWPWGLSLYKDHDIYVGTGDAFLIKYSWYSDKTIASLSPANFWVGLKNSDDQGTQFDIRTELYRNDALVAQGEALCITGVTRNPSYAKAVTVPFGPVSNGTYDPGDVLSLRVLTRIGTNPDGTKCSGPGGSHNNAVGLRLYYDAPARPSRIGAEIAPNPDKDYFLHSSSGNYFLNDVSPTGTVQYKDSSGVNYNNGNPWKEIGTWQMPLQ